MIDSIYTSLLEINNTDQVGEQVTEQVLKLISIIDQDVLSSKELMDRVNLKHRPKFRKK